MILSNPAKINFTKVNFIHSNTSHQIQKLICAYIYLTGVLNDEKYYYNKKIDYVDTLYITNTRYYYNYKKLNISKVKNITIFIENIRHLNFLINFCIQLKPNIIKFSFYENIEIPIIKLPYQNTFIELYYSIYIYKTIFHCGTLIINFGIETQNLITNLNFLNSNICHFKFKNLEFRYLYFSFDEKIKSEYIFKIKKILEPYPNIKFYTIT